jgi:hypothetical protein
MSMMHRLLTLVTLFRADHSVYLDTSATDRRAREQELYMGARKQDMLTKFTVSGVKGEGRW